MPADFSPYIDLTVYDVQPVDVYLGAIELARITMPEFTLRQGTPEDALFQAFAYMSSLSVGAINRLPSRLMEGTAKMLGVSRSYGSRASVVVEFVAADSDGAYIPAGSIFSFSEKIAGDTYQYTYELAEDVSIDAVDTGSPLTALATLYSQAIGLHPTMISSDPLVPMNVNVNLESVNVWNDGLSATGTIGSISANGLLQGSTTFTASGTSIAGAATYTGVTQSATSGTGSGAVFTIAKAGGGTAYSGAITVTITSGGAGYAIGNTITIPGASLGGAIGSTNNLILTIGGSLGSPWTATITNMESTSGFAAGSALTATTGSGTLHGGSPTSIVVEEILTTTSMKYTVTGGTIPTAGTVTNITGVYYPTPFTNGIEPENDFTYLSRVRTQIASLSDVLVTASQLQAYIATAYGNVSRCRVYDRTQSTNDSSLEIGAANSAGYVTAFVYGVGQNLSVGDRNTIGADLMSKSISGLTIGVKDFFRADVEINISVVYDDALQESNIELLVKSVIANSLSPDNFPTNEEHLRLSYISSYLLGIDGIISIGNVAVTAKAPGTYSDGNETNGDLRFKYKGTLPRILDIDTDITVVLIPRAV